ncbi:MAG: GHKL domain-containing protein, partial [Lachnospiraceae bacterium]|nr:GHKL domain-containing protein [Lachnospiraceae bacterium]
VIGLQSLEPYRPDEEQYNTCIFLSALLLLSLLIYQLRNLYETEHELAEHKDQQAEMITREYNTLQNAYSMNARLFHDFRNHLGALRSLLQTEQYEEAMRYVEDLAGPDTLSKTSWTGDDVIDYLISSKADVAKSLEIQFTAQVEFPKNTKLRSADLCSILGNLLDNAIEAAQKVPNPSGRFISLTIRRINHMILIRVENSFEKAPVTEGGTLRTTKTEGGLHGFGVKSARAAAEKYDGTLQTSFEGNVFRAVATLSLP